MSVNRILYVEDEPDIREIAQLALADLGGFELRLCASGTEALTAVETFEPDLILLDVMMPGMDGTETLAALRERLDLARIPVVFMTAKLQPEELARFRRLGAADIIPKPFDPITLPDQIRSIWTRWQTD
ncbi:MAG: response regulator [Candidatus Competibacterales bacterium]|nr:response regulator [Candidatus Competibacterales bacterium]